MVFTVTYDPLPNIRLVKAIEKQPIIYNTLYVCPSRKAIEEAWEKVAAEVNDTNAWCRERWVNLKNSYKRYLRQKRNNTLKKPYYLAQHMAFLEPYIYLSSRSEIKKTNGEHLSDTEVSSAHSAEKDDDDDDDFACDYLDQTNSSESVVNPSLNTAEHNKSVSDVAAQTVITCADGQMYSPEENFSKNHDLAFFISILQDVRTMTEEQKQRFQKEVVDSIDNILYAEDLTDV